MCYLTEAGISALGVFVMLDEAGISALGGKRVKFGHMSDEVEVTNVLDALT